MHCLLVVGGRRLPAALPVCLRTAAAQPLFHSPEVLPMLAKEQRRYGLRGRGMSSGAGSAAVLLCVVLVALTGG